MTAAGKSEPTPPPKAPRPRWSVATPIMERTVCPSCHHFHRVTTIKRCSCCKTDVTRMEDEQ